MKLLHGQYLKPPKLPMQFNANQPFIRAQCTKPNTTWATANSFLDNTKQVSWASSLIHGSNETFCYHPELPVDFIRIDSSGCLNCFSTEDEILGTVERNYYCRVRKVYFRFWQLSQIRSLGTPTAHYWQICARCILQLRPMYQHHMKKWCMLGFICFLATNAHEFKTHFRKLYCNKLYWCEEENDTNTFKFHMQAVLWKLLQALRPHLYLMKLHILGLTLLKR